MRRNHNSCFLNFSVIALCFFFILEFCPEHISKTILASYEISWVDRSHQGGVQCAGIITLASLNFQLLPFVVFHT